jgi:hypothetical protein
MYAYMYVCICVCVWLKKRVPLMEPMFDDAELARYVCIYVCMYMCVCMAKETCTTHGAHV